MSTATYDVRDPLDPYPMWFQEFRQIPDTERVRQLRGRVRDAMEISPEHWEGPSRIGDEHWEEPLPCRKARAIALKLSEMPTTLWEDQLFAGSLTLEKPRLHTEKGLPKYLTEEEMAEARRGGWGTGCFGHIVPDYPKLLSKGLKAVRTEALQLMEGGCTRGERIFLVSVRIALDGVMRFAGRLADACRRNAAEIHDPRRASELENMAANLGQVPSGPASSFWQALQSVWLVHMVFHATGNHNALGRLDQYAWPYLKADLANGRITPAQASELVDCFCLKFNERAETTEDQLPERRESRTEEPAIRGRHDTSSQLGQQRDRIDATNHWLQNIILGGITAGGSDGTNPVTLLLLRSYDGNEMTNPLLTVRLHGESPQFLVRRVAEVLKRGGGMPALFNDEAIVPALRRIGIRLADARDYTNDGCWEVIIPGRTDFRFQRLSLMLCLEWALNRGVSRIDGIRRGLDTGDPRRFTSYGEVFRAFLSQMDHMIGGVVRRVVAGIDDRHRFAPVPFLSALIHDAVGKKRDMTCGGARYRTHGMIAESAAHAIDSLTAIKTVIFEEKYHSMDELCDGLDADFHGSEILRSRLRGAPKYGNDDDGADEVGRTVIRSFCETVERHAASHRSGVMFPCGVGTFSWYIGIGEGLGASPDGRMPGEPVSSNFSPALGRDMEGIPAAILSYGKMPHQDLPAGGPLDLRIPKRLVHGEAGTQRMAALIRGFIDAGGSMMTLTAADTEELKAAQREPERYRSLRVRMGGWCAYFTMLSREQQDHHIRRQETAR